MGRRDSAPDGWLSDSLDISTWLSCPNFHEAPTNRIFLGIALRTVPLLRRTAPMRDAILNRAEKHKLLLK